MKLKIDTSLYRRNKHIAYWSFILCRPVLMPFFWYATYQHLKSGIFWEIEKATQFVWLIFGGLLDSLNLIWTRSLTIGRTYYFLRIFFNSAALMKHTFNCTIFKISIILLFSEYKNWLAEPKNKSHRKKINTEDRKLG